MSKFKTILFFSASLAIFGISCATGSVSFSHPSPASKTSLDLESICGEFKWKLSFTQTVEGVDGYIEVSHNDNSLTTINNNNEILKKFSRLELPAVTCTSRENNDGLFATTQLLLLGVNKSGDNTDFLTQISVDEAMQFEIFED